MSPGSPSFGDVRAPRSASRRRSRQSAATRIAVQFDEDGDRRVPVPRARRLRSAGPPAAGAGPSRGAVLDRGAGRSTATPGPRSGPCSAIRVPPPGRLTVSPSTGLRPATAGRSGRGSSVPAGDRGASSSCAAPATRGQPLRCTGDRPSPRCVGADGTASATVPIADGPGRAPSGSSAGASRRCGVVGGRGPTSAVVRHRVGPARLRRAPPGAVYDGWRLALGLGCAGAPRPGGDVARAPHRLVAGRRGRGARDRRGRVRRPRRDHRRAPARRSSRTRRPTPLIARSRRNLGDPCHPRGAARPSVGAWQQ